MARSPHVRAYHVVVLPQSPYSPDLDALTTRAAARMWNVYPGYSEEQFPHAELIPSVRGNLVLAVRIAHRGTGPTAEELRPARELGARRASQDVPLESIIQGYRQTERVIVLDLVQHAGAAAEPYADLVISCFDELTDAMINSYREASSAIEAERRRVADELVTSLATGLDVAPARFERWARTLRIGTDGRWVALAARELPDTGAQTLRRRLPLLLQARFRHLVVADVEGALLVLACYVAGDDEARTALRTALTAASTTAPLLCGIGEPTDALAATTSSCRQALEAVQVAAAGPDGPLTVVEYREALVDIVLGGHVVAADALHQAVLGPLHRYPYLVETLQVLVDENLSQSATARALYVHPNTVSHRLRRIHELTGRNPTVFPDALEIALALRWRRMRAHEEPTTEP
jgi:DNA-binding PucR family transcriptional regulator